MPDDIFLGYGITCGMDYILVHVPFIDDLGHNPFWILEQPEAAETARECLKTLFIQD